MRTIAQTLEAWQRSQQAWTPQKETLTRDKDLGQNVQTKGMRMLNLNQIRQDLLVAQQELEEELATVSRALQALGKPKESAPKKTTPAATTRKKKKKPEKPSENVLNLALKAAENSEQPLRTAEIARLIKKSESQTVKAMTYLRKEGKVTSSLATGQKGRVFLWSVVKKPEMERDLAPQPDREMSGWGR